MTTEPKKESVAWRVVLWVGGVMFGLVLLIVVAIVGAVLHNQYVRAQVKEFCDAFRSGQPSSQEDIVKRAEQAGYEARAGKYEPLNRRGDPLPTVLVRTISWSGTQWRCTVQLEDGRISATEFRGSGFR